MDITLYYLEKGTGEPFILLHGNGEDGSYFKHQFDHFSGRYRVIAIDTRGHGKSPRGTAPFTIEQFARDLYDFMEGIEITKAVIMVKALILNGGNLNPDGVKRATQLPIEIGYKIASRFASKSLNAKKNAEMLGLMVNEPHIERYELSKITMPTLVICGTNDMIRESHTREIAENIPYARLSILKGDHFIANKRPNVFNQAVEKFLDTI